MRMTMLVAAVCAVVCAGNATATAQARYPDKQINITMPGAPGGSYDIITRLIMTKLGERIGRPVIVQNVPGAAGMPALEKGARSDPDGYNFVVGYVGALAANPWLYKLRYDPVKDFSPVVLFGAISCVAAVPTSSDIKDMNGLIAAAKKSPGAVTYASAGVGTCGHIAAELLKSRANIDLKHVPYPSAAPASVALLGGHVDFAFEGMPTALPNIEGGKLRPLAVSSLKRSAMLPNIAAVSEFNMPTFDVQGWAGLLAPAGTPAEAINWMNQQVNEILKLPDVKEALSKQGFDILGGSPDDFVKLIRIEIDTYGKIIEASGIKPQ